MYRLSDVSHHVLNHHITEGKYAVLMFSCFFTLYYVCGFGLVFQGYLYKSYTNKLQITSGILAHGAELINPIIYGTPPLSLPYSNQLSILS
jgi:hypothetical protein